MYCRFNRKSNKIKAKGCIKQTSYLGKNKRLKLGRKTLFFSIKGEMHICEYKLSNSSLQHRNMFYEVLFCTPFSTHFTSK